MAARPTLRLITIRASHFCEKARWALQRAGMRFSEEAHAPIFHWLATARAGRGRQVPVLVTPHGPVADSTRILGFADQALAEPERLYPGDEALVRDVRALEDTFDEKLGPATRRLAYHHLLSDLDAFEEVLVDGVGRLEAIAFHTTRSAVAQVMRRGMRIDEERARRSRERIEALFHDVAARLADGRRYLTGSRFTAADLAFAALAAPVLRPLEYGVPLAGATARLPGFAEEVGRFRATPAGAFALRLYREERNGVVRASPPPRAAEAHP